MKEEMLDKIREGYEGLKKNNEKTIIDLDRLHQLEQNDLVQEYIYLSDKYKNYGKKKKLSDDDLIMVSFRGRECEIDDTNCIYVCLGEVRAGFQQDLYKRYMNVENRFDSHLVLIDNVSEYEDEHKDKIVHFSEEDGKPGFYKENGFEEVQIDFLREAIKYGQESACRKILSKKY